MKGTEDMFKLLQNEYEEYQEYFNELELIQRQYNQEEAYYYIINKLIRDSIDDKDISVRDVHDLKKKAMNFPGRNSCLRGYDDQVPEFVILHNDFEEKKDEKDEKQSGKVYGCVEIKPFSGANTKLYRKYIQLIEELLEKKSFQLVHEKSYQNRIKIEFESLEKKEEFKKYLQGNKEPIPISLENGDIKGKVFLCGGNKDLCLQIEENQSIEFKDNEIKPLEIQMQNDKVVLVPGESEKLECEYLVELKSKKIKEEKFSQENKECCNTIVCELLKELIGFKKVIFTNGYQWILIQCSETEFEKEKDKNGIKVTSPITVKDFQCKSLANFYPEPKDEATFNRLISSCEKDTQCKMISSCEEDTQCKKIAQCKKARETIEEFDGSWWGLGFAKKWSAFKKKDSEEINQAIDNLKNCYLKNFLKDKDINNDNVSKNLDKFEPGSVSRFLDLGLHLTEFQTFEDFKAWTAMTFAELQQHNFEQWLHLKLEINRIFKEAKSKNK